MFNVLFVEEKWTNNEQSWHKNERHDGIKRVISDLHYNVEPVTRSQTFYWNSNKQNVLCLSYDSQFIWRVIVFGSKYLNDLFENS